MEKKHLGKDLLGILILTALCLFIQPATTSGETKQSGSSFGEEEIDISKLNPAIQKMYKSPKIRTPQSVLKDFIDGKEKTRVIVILQKPTSAIQLQNLKDRNFRQQMKQSVKAVQDKILSKSNLQEMHITNRFDYIFGFSAELTQQSLNYLLDNPDVISIEKDEILYPHLAQGIPLMNASTARSSYNGSGIAIAICDTGIDYTHPRLGNGGFPNNKVIGGYDTGQNDADPMDGNGHGTCCAGIAAGDLGTQGDYIGGVAYSAKLYALKITYNLTGGSAYTSDMVEAWEWCVTHQNDDPVNPIMIISTSFGGGRFYDQASCDAYSTAMASAAANAKAVGISIFVSSGNDGYCDSTSQPGCLSDAIGVGAVYDANFGVYYPCINSGSCAQKTPSSGCSTGYYATDNTNADMVTSYSNTATFLSILAPSNQAYTTDIRGTGGYSSGDYNSSFGGTSAACPYAAGVTACLQSAALNLTGSFLTPDEVKSTLINSGDQITDGKVNITKPRVNLGAALEKLDYCACDLDQNSKCNMQDWLFFGKDWGRTNCTASNPCVCDLNHDGKCNMQDWLLFGKGWGRTNCPIIKWPMFRHDRQHTGRSTYIGAQTATQKWRYVTGGPGGYFNSSPSIGTDGTVYVGSNDGKIYALIGINGTQKWAFPTGNQIWGSPAIGTDGTVYVGSHDGNIYAFDGANGNLKWAFATGNGVAGSPSIGVAGTVYVGSLDGKVYALDGTNGTQKWAFPTGGQVDSSPAIGTDGTVYVGSHDGNIYAFDGANGNLKWAFTTDGPVRSSPSIGTDGKVYVGTLNGHIYALNSVTGQTEWSFTEGIYWILSSPAIGIDGTVYVGSDNGKVYALNGANGNLKWAFPTGGKVESSPAIGADGTVYVGSHDGKIYALDGTNGTQKWAFPTGSVVYSSPAIGADGTVYVASNNGNIYAIGE